MENQEFKGIIYKATNIVNGKCYIGQTVRTLDKRIYNHFYNAKKVKKEDENDCRYFYRTLRKYGIKNFKWEMLKECNSREMLNLMETFMIMVHKSHHTENGYNMNFGGDGQSGFKHTIKTKNKIKKSLDKINFKETRKKSFTENNPMKDPKIKEKIAILIRGMKKENCIRIKNMSDAKKLAASKLSPEERKKKWGNRKNKHWFHCNKLKIENCFYVNDVPDEWIKGRLPKNKGIYEKN